MLAVQCFSGDLSNKLGPLCYVGQFGLNAAIFGCPENYLCQVFILKNKNLKLTFY